MDDNVLFPKAKRGPYDYDVCLSFAGEDRPIATQIAKAFQRDEQSVFFDTFERTSLWGKDLFKYLFKVYSKQSRFCIILFSPDYLKKNWTNHELRAAQLRTLKERREYVLPVVVRRCRIPDEFSTVGYLDLKKDSIRDIVNGVSLKSGENIEEEGWITEDKLMERMQREFANETFANAFRDALHAEREPKKALAKALCTVIYLCQDEVEGAAAAYLSYLVMLFRPLTRYFRRNGRFCIQGKQGEVLRAISSDGRYKLYMHKDFFTKYAAALSRKYSSGPKKRSKAHQHDA